MVRQYIGARYVPRFTGLYDPTTAYEALDVVDNGNGTSYIAKIPTPPNTPLTNTAYWFLYGSTSGAIINLQDQINDINTALDGLTTKTYIIHSTGDTTDRSNEIITALTDYDCILFDGGDFYIASNVVVPNKKKLMGIGANSRIIANNTGYLFTIGDFVEIESLDFYGGNEVVPITIGYHNCVQVTNTGKKCKITNCNFIGFDGIAINCEANGDSVSGSLNIVNCFFRTNGVGVDLGQYGEYALINNCTFIYNNYGTRANGGNNRFTACNFGYNTQAAIVDGSGISNSAHGQFIGCSFNHNDNGLKICNTINGEDVIGCLFYANTGVELWIEDAVGGINVESCQFGSSSSFYAIGLATRVNMANNVFRDAPTLNLQGNETVNGLNNTLHDGTPILLLNLNSKPTGSYFTTKTYASNSYVTEAQFAYVTGARSGSMLSVTTGFTVQNLPSSTWVTIGNIGATLLQQCIVDCFDGTNHMLFSIETNGDLRIYGISPSNITGPVRVNICIPLSNT